jgi:hypothetical protein
MLIGISRQCMASHARLVGVRMSSGDNGIMGMDTLEIGGTVIRAHVEWTVF